MTAPLVFAGALAAQVLQQQYGISISSQVVSIHRATGEDAQRDEVLAARRDGDSVGGIVQCRACGVPAGWGGPQFSALESVIASLVFAVPAVKGIEFGLGFGFAARRGSEVADELCYDDSGNVCWLANNNGGINGGISNGADLQFNVVLKPTPTIGLPLRTIDLQEGTNVTHAFAGRHDDCIVGRAQVVLEAALAVCLMEVRACG
jgi:chorismate synthase